MPLPEKNKGEKRDDFIARCIVDPKMKSEFPDSRQRAAICYQQSKK